MQPMVTFVCLRVSYGMEKNMAGDNLLIALIICSIADINRQSVGLGV